MIASTASADILQSSCCSRLRCDRSSIRTTIGDPTRRQPRHTHILWVCWRLAPRRCSSHCELVTAPRHEVSPDNMAHRRWRCHGRWYAGVQPKCSDKTCTLGCGSSSKNSTQWQQAAAILSSDHAANQLATRSWPSLVSIVKLLSINVQGKALLNIRARCCVQSAAQWHAKNNYTPVIPFARKRDWGSTIKGALSL